MELEFGKFEYSYKEISKRGVLIEICLFTIVKRAKLYDNPDTNREIFRSSAKAEYADHVRNFKQEFVPVKESEINSIIGYNRLRESLKKYDDIQKKKPFNKSKCYPKLVIDSYGKRTKPSPKQKTPTQINV